MSAEGWTAAAISLVESLAAERGLKLDLETLRRIAGEAAGAVTQLLDGHAKKKAEAAGDAAAAAITTEDAAEAEQRKP